MAYTSGPEQRKIQGQKGVRGMHHPSVADHKMTNVSDPFCPFALPLLPLEMTNQGTGELRYRC